MAIIKKKVEELNKVVEVLLILLLLSADWAVVKYDWIVLFVPPAPREPLSININSNNNDYFYYNCYFK